MCIALPKAAQARTRDTSAQFSRPDKAKPHDGAWPGPLATLVAVVSFLLLHETLVSPATYPVTEDGLAHNERQHYSQAYHPWM